MAGKLFVYIAQMCFNCDIYYSESERIYSEYEDGLQLAVDHDHATCSKVTSCPYDTKLIDKRIW